MKGLSGNRTHLQNEHRKDVDLLKVEQLNDLLIGGWNPILE